jgi:hypothetical protein
MADRNLVVGVLDTRERIGDPDLAEKLRDFTLSCCRFDFDGPLFESSSVDELLAEACRSGARYCLVQACGHAMVRHGDRQRATDTNLIKALTGWLPQHGLLVAGRLLDGGERWYGLDELSFAVSLDEYRRLGMPPFTPPANGPRPLPAGAATTKETPAGTVLGSIRPRGGTTVASPALPGWGLVAASLEHGMPVLGFDSTLRQCGYDLRPRNAAEIAGLRRFAGAGILDYDAGAQGSPLSADWHGFLDYVQHQAKHARRGIFLGNFESYRDVETPPVGFRGPLSGLYAVAAGFKANRILHTHGFDRRTRMVYFDYSPLALDLRKILVDEWNGVDFPGFVRGVAGRLPAAFYQLWGNLWATRPGALDLELVAAIWDRELQTWGGEAAFREHWASYREIPHEFILCDLFTDSAPLLNALATGPGEVMWWSNAFHSLNGVWFYPREDRHRIYRRWLADVAAINPDLLLYGTDVDNLGLGGIRLLDHRGGLA